MTVFHIIVFGVSCFFIGFSVCSFLATRQYDRMVKIYEYEIVRLKVKAGIKE